VREKRIGYLAVWSETLQKEDLQSIGVLSQQLAVSIDNLDLIDTIRRQTEELKNLSLKLIQVQEQERRTVSQELHDEVGQALTAVAFTLGTIKNDVPTRLPGMFKQRLDEAISITEDVLEQVRELSRSLHPSVLDDLGLTATLNWFVNRYQSAVGIETRLDVINFEETLKPETALAVYRVVQEALTNVARHAQATRVSIMLKKEGSTLMGTIEDNGKGCDQTKGDSTGPSRTWGGVGLVGMRERISLVGGDFSIQFRPGKGTTISFLIPLKEEVA